MKKTKTVLAVATLSLLLGVTGCQKKSSDEHLQAALAFVQQGDANAAIVELKNAIQISPKNAQARFTLGKIYLDAGQFEAAEKELSKALEAGGKASQIVPLLSRAYQRTGANAALSGLDHQDLSLTAVERIELGFYKVQSLAQLNQVEEARSLIKELSSIDTSSVYKGLVQAFEAVLENDYEKALSQAQALRAQAPLNKDVLSLTARLYLLNDQATKAANTYSEYLKAAPNDHETRFALANLLVEQGRTQDAEPHVDTLLKVSQQNALLNQLKAVIRAADKDYAQALSYAKTAILNGRTDPVVRMVAGYAAYQLGDYVSAEEQLSVIASNLPDDHPGLRILAASQLQNGNSSEAGDVLGRLDSLGEEDAKLLAKAGFEMIQSGNIDQAKSMVDKAAGLSQSSDDLMRLGVLRLSLNNLDGIVDLESALQKTPDSVSARSNLARVYLATEQLDKASSLAEQWLIDEPSSAQAHLLNGGIALRQVKFEAALQAFEQARNLAPDDVQVAMAFVGLDVAREDYTAAANKLASLLDTQSQFLPALSSYYSLQKYLGQANTAIERVQKAAQLAPQNHDIAVLLARVYASEKDYDKALKASANIPADRSAPLQYWPVKAGVLLQSSQMSQAQEHYDAWRLLYPQNTNAMLGSLLLLDAQAQYDKGTKLIEEYLQSKDDIKVKVLQSYFYVMNKQIAAAKTALASIEPNIQALPFLRGVAARIAVAENRAVDGLLDAQIAYDALPNLRNMLLLLQIYDASGEDSSAYSLLQSFTQTNPNDARALLLLAERDIQQDQQKAIAGYKKAIALNGNNFVALNNLAYLLMQQGDLEAAQAYAKRAYELRPSSVAVVDTYAQVLVKQQQVPEAVAVYLRADLDDVKDEQIFLNYIETLLMNKDIVVAQRRLDSRVFSNDDAKQRAQALKTQYNL